MSFKKIGRKLGVQDSEEESTGRRREPRDNDMLDFHVVLRVEHTVTDQVPCIRVHARWSKAVGKIYQGGRRP